MRQQQCFIFGPFRFDLSDERLWRGHEVVRILPKTFAVLRCLVTQAGQLVTKDALLQEVWPATVVSEDVLTVAIRQLRRVLGDQARRPQFIETVHGRGYRFIAPVAVAALAPERPQIGQERQLLYPTRVPPRIFVGREASLAQMWQWWATALQGQRQIGFIAGEPGLGKTALVDIFMAQVAAAEDIWVAYGQCVDQYGAGEGYLPLLEALGRLGRGPDGSEVVALLHQHAPSWLVHLPALLASADRAALVRTMSNVTAARMLRELAEALEVLTASRPLVLVLEDLHWSDHATLAWLAYLARRPDPARLLVLSTYRPVEVIVEAHPLRRMITELQHHGQCTEMVLDYLSEAAVATYLEQSFGAMPRLTGLAQVLHRYTHGNPLFLRTVVEEAVAQQLLENTAEGWRLHEGSETITGIVPESLRRLIEQQLEQLAPDEQALLEAASVAGSTFTVAAVAAGVVQPEERIDERYATWARQGRFVHAQGTETWPDGTVTACYSFRHALYHEVVYRRVAAGQRLRLHRRIGLHTEAGYGAQAPTMATVLAMHFTRAQDPHRAVQYLRHAAANAVQRAAYQEAVACLEQALIALHHLPECRDTLEQAIDLRQHLYRPLLALGEYGRLHDVLHEAVALAEALGDQRRLGWAVVRMSHLCLLTRDLDHAIACGQRALALATSLGDLSLHAMAHCCLGETYYARGDYRRASDVLRQSVVALEGEVRLPSTSAMPSVAHHRVACRRWLVFSLAEEGVFAEGLTRGEEAVQYAEAEGYQILLIQACLGLGSVYLRKGDVHQAMVCFDRGLELGWVWSIPHWHVECASALSAAQALAGQVTEALALLAQTLPQVPFSQWIERSSLALSRVGEVYLLAGCLEGATAHAVRALALARNRQERGVQAWSLRLLGAISGSHNPPAGEQAEDAYRHALALAEELGMRPLQAHCHRGLGMLYATTGQRQQARLALATAMALYRSMEMTFWLPETQAALAQVEGGL